MRRFTVLPLIAMMSLGGVHAQTPVLTYHNNNARTGYSNHETALTWANVNPGQFGKLFSYSLDGQMYTQPLYVPGLAISGGTHNVVFAATENNSVYAFDGDSDAGANGGVLWHVNFNSGPAGTTVTPVPSDDLGCGDLAPQIGITGTPVIDPTSQTLYVVAKTKEVSNAGTNYVQRLHALDIATGQEKFGGPVVIEGSIGGSCGNTDGKGNIVFDPLIQHQRPGLALVNGTVYISWASHCDIGSYNGWVMGYNATTLQQTAIFNTSPDAATFNCRSGIWQSGAAPAADSSGNLFFMTGNGTFNASQGGHSYGDSFLKLSTTGPPTVSDYYTPINQANLDSADLDLGAGGPMLLPDQPGRPHLLVGAGKTGTIIVVNRDDMGKNTVTGAVQQIPSAVGPGNIPFPPPAFFNQVVYFAGSYDTVKAFRLLAGRLAPKPIAQSAIALGATGGGISITSDAGGNNGIVWVVDASNPGTLHAYKAGDLTELYNSSQSGTRDNYGKGIKYSLPTVSGGKVYVGSDTSLAVFGNF